MSVKFGIMALLSEGPRYGAQLRAEFEERTGGTWPLNVGQIYTTLGRLERDGLVQQDGEADAEGRISYRLTEAGLTSVTQWWLTPVDRDNTPRDELVIKLALAVTAPGVDVQLVAQRQRTATLTHLRDLTRLKQTALDQIDTDQAQTDVAWLLVLENLIFVAEAEVRWLDHVESRLARRAVEAARIGRITQAQQTTQPLTADDAVAGELAATGEHTHPPIRPSHDKGNHAMTEPTIELTDVYRTHGTGDNAVHALSGVNLQVFPGELVAVMGPSGSGKSTLLNVAGGLDRPTSGRVVIAGTDLGSLNAKGLAELRRRRVGFVFQDYNLIPSLTAAENVGLPLEFDGLRARKARRVARNALDLVGLSDLADRYPDAMSGGQQQRVAIARALVGSRRVVMADEPTGALDTHTGEEVLRVLRARCDEGASGLLVTHEARHAAWADRVVFIRDGVIVDTTRDSQRVEDLLAGAR